MKVAPLYHALSNTTWSNTEIVHTGQHYDANMSDVFFRELGLPQPDYNLGVGSGSHAMQTGQVMIAYEQVCLQSRPDWVIVVGDVNSTVACSLVATKLSIPVVHLEAGLRSRDRRMPEEINRIVTDAVADVLWTPSADADENLLGEGIPSDKIDRIGNIMIDSLEMMRSKIESSNARKELELTEKAYAVVTLHRPSNVDDHETLSTIVDKVIDASEQLPIVFVVHPRTLKNLRKYALLDKLSAATGVVLLDPMPYVDFMNIVFQAKLVITDSGGLQEETTYLNIPCLTMRENTERPITISHGTNKLVTAGTLSEQLSQAVAGKWPSRRCPDLWDGRTASRAVESLKKRL